MYQHRAEFSAAAAKSCCFWADLGYMQATFVTLIGREPALNIHRLYCSAVHFCLLLKLLVEALVGQGNLCLLLLCTA